MACASTFRAAHLLAALAFALSLGGCAERTRTGTTCSPVCSELTQACCDEGGSAICKNIVDDPANCGGCGIACASGMCRARVCVVGEGGPPPGDGSPPGMCSPMCSSSQRCCGTTCVNRSVVAGTDGRSDSSFSNCNGCGLACDAMRASACSSPVGMSSAPQCLCGNFGQCAMGDVCVESGSTFQCVNLSTDRNNCGMIGHACAEGESCSGGMCGCGGTMCGTGTACCGGSCIDVTSNAANCGSCGTACGPNAPNCVASHCVCGTSGTGCVAPVMGSLGESCCSGSCVPNSDASCGCGVTCPSGDTCIFASGGLPIPGLGMGLCCGTEIPFLGGLCSGFGLPDGGFPGLDAGLPFP